MHCVFLLYLFGKLKKIYLKACHYAGSVSPIKKHSTECPFLGQGLYQNRLVTHRKTRQTLISI